MTTRWHCRILQEEFGPVDLAELRALAESETLSRDDLVRREDAQTWIPARECAELHSAFNGSQDSVGAPHPKDAPSISQASDPPKSVAAKLPIQSASRHVINDQTHEPADTLVPARREFWWTASVTCLVLLVLFVVDHVIAHRSPTFPPTRQIREQLAGQFWFLGTGPWAVWECRLLWLDSLVITFCLTLLLRRQSAV